MKHAGNNEFWEQVESGLWEPETFKVLDRFCEDGKTFIDIGAWNGVCSLYAGSKGAICYAVEPDRKAYDLLIKNIALNDYNIIPKPCCISDIDGIVNLNTQYKNGFGNSMSSIVDRGVIADSIDCYSVTLESFIELSKITISDVSLIKIDIEGGEVGLIKQASKFLKLHKPNIYISLHPAWFPNGYEDIKMIRDIIFDIYNVADTSGRQYSKDEFLQSVNSGVHSFILTV